MKKLTVLFALLLALVCMAAAEETEPAYEQVTYSSAGYSLTLGWQEDTKPSEEIEGSIVALFLDKYPALRETFGTNEDRTFTLYLVNTLSEGAISSNNEAAKVAHDYVTTPRGMNHLISLFFKKVANGCPNPENDAVITVLSQGLQAYAEYAYSDMPEEAIWLKPYEEGQQLTDGGQIAGSFIKWVAARYGKDIPVRLNRVLHEGTYGGDEFWMNAIGNTLGNLWNEYAASSTAE